MVTGVSIVRKRYHSKESDKESHLILRDGLVAAIQGFASTVFKDQVETFVMKDSKVLILSGRILVEEREEPLYVYAICDKDAPEKAVREALNRIREAFTEAHPQIDKVSSQSAYRSFERTIDRILGDLVLRPQDRISRLL